MPNIRHILCCQVLKTGISGGDKDVGNHQKGSIASELKNGIGFGTTELHVIRPSSQIDKKFLYYLTISYDFRQFGAGMMQGTAGQKRVPDSFLIDYPVTYPPLPEQRAIAAYLDRATARIDALITKKQRLLDLLAEKRTALISQAVTKGLNPDVQMKDSGVAWLGQMPGHWEVRRVKTITPFVTSGSRWWAQY
jgi:type I restriction enzyme S subunit